MSHSAYVILFGHYLKRCFNILMSFVLLAFFKWDLYVFDRLLILLVMVGVNLFLALFLAFFDYYYKQFHIQDGKLVFRHGVFRREVISIPLCRVQSLRIQQGMLYRLLDLKGLSFDTLASRSEEVEMVLDVDDWEALMTQVDTLKADADSPSLQSTLQPTDRATGVTRLTIRNLNLIKGALCQNHLQGMTVLFGILLTLYNLLQSVDDSALFDALDYLDQHASLFTFSLRSLLVLGGFFYLFVLLLWMGKVFSRYYQTTIEINGDLLTFECGLLSRRSSRIVLKDDYLEIHSGGFAAATDYLKYSNVEVVRLRATPFTPRFHRVRLHLDTNGSTWVVRSLKEDEAQAIYEVLLQRCDTCRRLPVRRWSSSSM